MASTYMIGYRIAMIAAGDGALWVAAYFDFNEHTYEQMPWFFAYFAMAGLMGIGLITTLLIHEPKVSVDAGTLAQEEVGSRWLRSHGGLPGWMEQVLEWVWRAVISPFVDFVRRYKWHAVLLLALIATYRISDVVLGVITNVFYYDMGFTKFQVANVSKVFGLIATLVGAMLGGALVGRFGVMPILFVGALLSAITNLLFAALAYIGYDLPMLVAVVAMDNLSGGLAVAAFVAYLSGLTNVSYSATQYALFSSTMMLLPKFIGGFSGLAVDEWGYAPFFVGTALLGVPVLGLVWAAWHHIPAEASSSGR